MVESAYGGLYIKSDSIYRDPVEEDLWHLKYFGKNIGNIEGVFRFKVNGRPSNEVSLSPGESTWAGLRGHTGEVYTIDLERKGDNKWVVDDSIKVRNPLENPEKFPDEPDMLTEEELEKLLRKPDRTRKILLATAGVAGITAGYFILKD